jgi:hypothetical protein
MITEHDIEAALLVIDAAAQDAADAEGLPPGPGSGALWAGAQGRLRQAIAAHARLLEERDAEAAAAVARAAAEKGSSERLAAMSKEAAAGRDKLGTAVSAAQAALVALIDAAAERNAGVASHATELAELGLGAMAEGGEYENGVAARGAVLLRGEWWLPVKPDVLLSMVVERVRATQFGTHAGVECELRMRAVMLGLRGRKDLGLDDVELPPEVQQPARLVVERQIPKSIVGISDWRREQEARDREVTWTKPDPRADGGPRYIAERTTK